MDPFVDQLKHLCAAYPTRSKWVVVPSHGIGHTLGDRLAREGTDWANLRFVTQLDLALRMSGPFLVERGITPSEDTLGPALMMRLLLDLPENAGYFRPMPRHTGRVMLNEPNLVPRINRNYGASHPLKTLRLDLTMERIRVDVAANQYLRNENLDNPGRSEPIDASYAGLLQRYRQSDAPSVRYTAEFELARLNGQPNLDLWIDVLSTYPGTPFQGMALQIIGGYAAQFSAKSPELTGNERAQLIAAAVTPDPVNRELVPKPPPAPDTIVSARASNRFGFVRIVIGSGPRAASGYSMLFERRNNRWVFLMTYGGWIS